MSLAEFAVMELSLTEGDRAESWWGVIHRLLLTSVLRYLSYFVWAGFLSRFSFGELVFTSLVSEVNSFSQTEIPTFTPNNSVESGKWSVNFKKQRDKMLLLEREQAPNVKSMSINSNALAAVLRFPRINQTRGFPALSASGDEYSLYRADDDVRPVV